MTIPALSASRPTRPTMHQGPVFILGCHKSGTSLLRALLDGHPKLAVVPVETHAAALMGAAVNSPWRCSAGAVSDEWATVVDAMLQHLSALNDANPLGGSWTGAPLDIEGAARRLRRAQPASFDERFHAYMEAVFEATGVPFDPATQRIVEKSVDHGEFAPWFDSRIPGARFVSVVRNPYANLVSLRKYMRRRRVGSLRVAVMTIAHAHRCIVTNSRFLSNHLLVRYEDLVLGPTVTLERVCTFLGIEPVRQPRPTVAGRGWRGNSTTRSDLDGVSATPSRSWQHAITPIEVLLVNRFLSDSLSRYDYSPVEVPLWRSLAPLSGESVAGWAANRSFLRWR